MRNFHFIQFLVLLISIPVYVKAQFEYLTNSDGTSITIIGYSGPNNVVIPSTLNGLSVTDIGYRAFAVSDITSVVIPNGVTNIDEDAFNPCDYLTNVVLPDSLVSVGNSAFLKTALTSLTIPPNLVNVGDGAFDIGLPLTNVTIDYGLTDIQYISGGFSSIVIPATVTNVGFDGVESVQMTNIFFEGNAPAVTQMSFTLTRPPQSGDPYYYNATAYYLPGTTGWTQFESNTLRLLYDWHIPSNIYVPAVMWYPPIQATNSNFGIQNGQYGFDITATTNLPIAI